VVRRGPRRRCPRAGPRTAAAASSLAQPRRADGERSRAAGRPAPCGNRNAQGAIEGSWRDRRDHVGERLCRIRAVPDALSRGESRPPALPERGAGLGHAHVEPRGTRKAGPAARDTPVTEVARFSLFQLQLSFSRGVAGPRRRAALKRRSTGSGSVSSAEVGRGQAVRRGTLDPVFGGSNPPAPTRSVSVAGIP
jgi:hypothetical protein